MEWLEGADRPTPIAAVGPPPSWKTPQGVRDFYGFPTK